MSVALTWKALSDARGPVLRYVAEDREGTPIADLARVVSGRTAADAAASATVHLPAWLLATEDLALANRLVMAGATPKRHAIVMQCDLREPLPAEVEDPRFTWQPLPTTDDSERWTAILPSWRAAFPADHPDHFAGDDPLAIGFIMRLVDGSELGPLHRSSTLLADATGRPVAGIIINVRSQDPPWGGPWIADLWRDPSLRGTAVGPLLIAHAKRLLADDGFVSLGLAVTSGNPARKTYQEQCFRTVVESQTLLLPGRPQPTRYSSADR